MATYLDLYILINIACAILVLLFALHSRIGMGAMVSQRLFASAMVVLVIFYMSDTVWYAMDSGALPQIRWVSLMLKTIYFLSATTVGYLWFLYMGSLTKLKRIESQHNKFLAGILLLVHIVLCVVNLFNPILFGIDQNFVYFRGPMFGIQYVLIYIYPLVASAHALLQAFRPENYIDRTRYLIISTFPVLPAISGILQLFYWRVPFNCVAFTLGVTIVYLTELSQQVSQEPLTQLSNRKQLMRSLEQSMAQHRYDGQLHVFMMDLDHFKSINDTYGHTEGDQALIEASKALKQAVQELHQKAILARYGGDEFAIGVCFEKPEEAEELKLLLQEAIEQQNRTMNKPYKLYLSIGIAQYTPEMESIKDLLDAADKQLYQEKKARRAAASLQGSAR